MQRSVAIIGASNDRGKFGNKAVRAYAGRGFAVYPVNVREREIEGLKTYKSILDIPVELDRVTVYLPPEVTLKVLDEIASKGVKEVFLNPGSEDERVLEKARLLGINAVVACSILDIGETPAAF